MSQDTVRYFANSLTTGDISVMAFCSKKKSFQTIYLGECLRSRMYNIHVVDSELRSK